MRKIGSGARGKTSATLPALTDMSANGVRKWITEVCRAAGMTPTQLAREASFPPATVNRFLNATKGAPKNLTASTIATLQATAVRLLSPSASADSQRTSKVGQGWAVRNIEVMGSIEGDKWHDNVEWPREERVLWPVPIPNEYGRYHVIALQVEDDSADLLYPPQALLTCVSFAELARSPRSGERVIVHRVNDAGATEVTVREYLIDDGRRAWLVSRSSRPDVLNIPLGEHDTDLPEGVSIPYRVIGSYLTE